MKSLTESPAILTVHAAADGQYILRTTDLNHRPLLIGVTKLLPDARSFVIVTPSDIKVFAVSDNGKETNVGQDATNSTTGIMDPDTEAAINTEEGRSLPGDSTEEVAPPRTVKRKKSDSVAGHDEKCQRCAGTGRIQIILDGGAASDTACGICKGTGVMRRYGARR